MVAPRSTLPVETTEIQTSDGATLAVHATRPPRPGAPVVLLANGLGGPALAWRALLEDLGDRYRFVTWDYRGLFGSTGPRPEFPGSFSIPRHVDDLRTVLRNGTYGRPLHTASPVAVLGPLVPRAVALASRLHGPLGAVTRRASTIPYTVKVLKALGLIGAALDEGEFAKLVKSFGELDMQVFLKNLSALGEHDASRVLPRIEVPTLVIAGDRDLMTPRGLSQQMVRRIPKAEILVVRGGTHYTAVEYPELVNLRIETFFRGHGFF